MITIEFLGEEQIQAIVKELSGDDWLKKPTNLSAALIQKELATYPPPPAGSTYRRTGTLGRRWQFVTEIKPFRVVANVFNTTSYAPFVEGSMTQARIHQGRWPTDEQVVEESLEPVAELYADSVNEVFEDNT